MKAYVCFMKLDSSKSLLTDQLCVIIHQKGGVQVVTDQNQRSNDCLWNMMLYYSHSEEEVESSERVLFRFVR